MQCSRRQSCSRVLHFILRSTPLGCSRGVARRCFLCPLVHPEVLAPVQSKIPSLSAFVRDCRTSNAGAGMGGKSYVAAWKKGEESESVSSGNDGMAAAVLSPGRWFLNKN